MDLFISLLQLSLQIIGSHNQISQPVLELSNNLKTADSTMFFPPSKEPYITDSLIKNQLKYAKKQQQKQRQTKLLEQQLVNQALSQPPNKRQNSDHQRVWKYFEAFDFFKNIEHDFSVYSKIQAIAYLRRQQQNSFHYKQKQSQRHNIIDTTYLTSQPQELQNIGFAFQHVLLQKNKIILLKSDYLRAINKIEQQRIKQIVQILRKYSSLSSLAFEHLLYLSYYSKIRSYNFKEIVYQTGTQPLQCYLVQSGQFHIVFEQQLEVQQKSRYDKSKNKSVVNKQKNQMNVSQINQSINLANQNSQSQQKNFQQQLKKNKKNIKIKTDLLKYDDPSPNRIYKKFKKESKLNIILGGMGSCFGEQQFVQGGKRLYKAQCMSTQNCVIVIKKEHYSNLLSAVPEFKKSVRMKINNQNLQKSSMISKIQQTKRNLKKYIAEIQKSTDKLHKSQIQTAQIYSQNLQKSRQHLKYNEQYDKLSSGLPQLAVKHKAYSNVKVSGRQNLLNFNSQSALVGSLQLNKDKSSQSVHYREEGFGLTNANSDSARNTVDVSPYRQQKQIQFRKPQKLPMISAISSPSHSFNDVIQFRVGKSWSTKKDKFFKLSDKAKYVGMIDSETLIKEKQYILSQKNKTHTRKAIFPEYQNNLSTTNINLALKKAGSKVNISQKGSLQKQKSRQNVSIAHSKRFMQKLLIGALQKSGYSSVNEELSNNQPQNRNKISPTESFHLQSNKKPSEGASYLFKRQKNKKSGNSNFHGSEIQQNSQVNWQKQKKNVFLESNAFDNCYFKKL